MNIRTFVAKSRTFVAKSAIWFSENEGGGVKGRYDANDGDDDNDDDGLLVNSHHYKIPPWWEYISNRCGGILSRQIPTIQNQNLQKEKRESLGSTR